jgi:hypothetical protein
MSASTYSAEILFLESHRDRSGPTFLPPPISSRRAVPCAARSSRRGPAVDSNDEEIKCSFPHWKNTRKRL